MNWLRSRFSQKSLSTIVCQFAGIGLLTVSVWSTGGPPRKQNQMSQESRAQMRSAVKKFEENIKIEDLKIINKTRKFEVVNIERENGLHFALQLTLRNGYKKGITAFSYGVGGPGVCASPDLSISEIDSESRIPPGGTTIEHSGISPTSVHHLPDGSISIPREENLFVIIYAVIFNDKTADGDPKVIDEMWAFRTGLKRVETLKNLLLQRLLDASDLDLDSLATPPELVLDRLRTEFPSLTQDAAASDNQIRATTGINVHGEIAAWFGDLEPRLRWDSSTSLRKKLTQMKQTQEQILSRF